jgi:hypothetical protein
MSRRRQMQQAVAVLYPCDPGADMRPRDASTVEPMAVLHVSSWEERALYALAPLATVACVVAWCWS